MNNRTQQRFDRSTREAARASGQAEANDRAYAARVRREMPAVMSKAVPSNELDVLISRLVERDNLQAE